MKILHIRNMANVAYNLAQQQNKMGHKALTFDIIENYSNEHIDISLDLPMVYSKKELPKRCNIIIKNLLSIIRKEKFDIFHLHDAGIFPQDIDIPLFFKQFGKVVVHWHGNKLRDYGETFGSRFADAKIVATPDLLRQSPNAIWIPNCVPWHKLKKIDRDDDKIIIGHAPTDRSLKGTDHFLRAMDALMREYPCVEYLLIEHKPHSEALALLQTCDIVVDSVDPVGWYGVLTCEVLQMGIPSCVLIKPEYEALVGEISGIVGITPHTIEDELARLIQDESLRVKLGDAGKRYVKRVHDNEIITAQIERIYNFI